MKEYGIAETEVHALLSLAQDIGEWQAWRLYRLTYEGIQGQ
jgi:hypothetical protein